MHNAIDAATNLAGMMMEVGDISKCMIFTKAIAFRIAGRLKCHFTKLKIRILAWHNFGWIKSVQLF
jgi:hypothetical protein